MRIMIIRTFEDLPPYFKTTIFLLYIYSYRDLKNKIIKFEILIFNQSFFQKANKKIKKNVLRKAFFIVLLHLCFV